MRTPQVRSRLVACVTVAALAGALAYFASLRHAVAASGASHAATFVTLQGTDTVSVEHVRDVAGGYVGEIITSRGVPWIRYRVWVGPAETVTRVDIAMTSMVGAQPGDIPHPFVSARHDRDSVTIEPALGMGLRGRRIAVPRPALLGMGYSIASEEQMVRRARALGEGEVRLSLVEAMMGQSWPTTVTPVGGNQVRIRVDTEEWRFTTDGRGRILSGRHSFGLEVRRIDPALPLPVNRLVTLPDSARQVMHDAREARWERMQAMEAQVRALAWSRRPVGEIRRAIDPLLPQLGGNGGARLAQIYVEVADALRARPDALAAAERYARLAVASADTHSVRLYGDHGLLPARASARRALADVQLALGRRDSALLLLRAAIESVPEFDEFALQRDLRLSLASVLEAEGREDHAIAALFEAVALDTNPDSLAARGALHRLWNMRFGDDADLDARIDRARRLKWAQAMGGGASAPMACPAPSWSLPGLAGGVTNSSSFAGRPTAVVFWGGWTGGNRAMLLLADGWYRRRVELGVEIVSVNWELPGPGPISTTLAREFIARDGKRLPVLLDHDQAVFERFGGEAYPQVFLIDRRGSIVRTAFGGAGASVDSLTAWVEALGRGAR